VHALNRKGLGQICNSLGYNNVQELDSKNYTGQSQERWKGDDIKASFDLSVRV
jgi:hypothetical protein